MQDKIVNTLCTMDCPDACALEIKVREGRIAGISAGTSDHPDTAGFICAKISRFDRRVYHEDRLLHPMRRVGPKGSAEFERISWDEAFDLIVRKFKGIVAEFGGEAILPYHYGGSNGVLGDEFMDDYFFARLGASRLAKTLCATPTTEVATGMYGKMPGVAFGDYPRAKLILVWGANPKASNIHLVPYLLEARKNGAFVAVVDPGRRFSKGEADLHLPVFPGTDLPVALALIRYWWKEGLLDQKFLENHAVGLQTLLVQSEQWTLEKAAAEARIEAADIKILADRYASLSPAVLRCGWGLERNLNGGQAVAAVLALPALLGKLGVVGGGYTLSNSGAVKLKPADVFGEIEWTTRTINMSQLGRVLTDPPDPPVKGLFVYNCNPVATAPDQNAVMAGLEREDLFTVVHEQVMTDTCRFADVLLPATTFLEQKELKKGYGSYVVGSVEPAIDPVGEALPNETVFSRLGRKMGWSDEVFDLDTTQLRQKAADALRQNGEAGLFSAAGRGGVVRVSFGDSGTPVQFKSVFPKTDDGKIHLTPGCLGTSPFEYRAITDPGYPLALISPATSKMISSSLGEFNCPELRLSIHPDDAAARGLGSGDRVRIFNALGEVVCRLDIDDRIRPGVVSLPKGAWRKSSLNRSTSTALCPQHVNVVGGGACFNDARVQVEQANE